jgi:hypothetical protein
MAITYRVEAFDAAALDEITPDGGNELERRLNELASVGWKVLTMTSDEAGYVVMLQRTASTRKR